MKIHFRQLINGSALFLISMSFIACNNTNTAMSPELSAKISADERLSTVSQKAEDLIKSGFNAGDGYSEVWIRDLNTFVEPACKVSDTEKLKDALLTFFKFQGTDGNIVDGYTAIKNANGGTFFFSELAPEFAAHKNTVETDQETSLIQAIYKYVTTTGDKDFLKEEIAGRSVQERMSDALNFLLKERYNEEYGLLWGATTADWGDVQPEHDWGVYIDSSSHFTIDIYDNAMFLIAIDNYINLVTDQNIKDMWAKTHKKIADNTRKHLWDEANQKFIPHIYLNGSPFPADFNENAIYYHGGTAVAIEAGLLSKEEIKTAYKKMQENVKAAGAQTIGLTMYPVYPNGFFKNPGMHEYGYQNGGDWTWFGGRMVQQLVANGFYDEAYEALSPMLDRVIKHNGFYEWWTPAGEPKGSGMFRGSAGVLWKAIKMLEEKK
ncbi:amylo-alpha-1,6-glucosidase [Dysgonomonas sp. ZJ709]|uniref:amylo-alpha-1,6-glucosidase n=1 Tax=Dysgonomonas sp. ZJ709 TaxID=2709797 RepID=UPI001624416E|nr:amylo-alpha-1,6-glucosidase [Dysgonomonas sp. ZJ709]